MSLPPVPRRSRAQSVPAAAAGAVLADPGPSDPGRGGAVPGAGAALADPDPDVLARTVAALRAAGCVFAEEEAALLIQAAVDPDRLADMVRRRVAGLPLEHILGWAEFHGLRVAVDPGVFVPRRRTELLVRRALDPSPRVVVDLCCGSGAVGVALATAVPGIELYAVDIDPAAVRCARRNLAGTGARVYRGDLYEPLPAGLRGRVDVLVANAPYVPTGAVGLLPPEARVHEPLIALDGGEDGLDVLRRVIARAGSWLAPGGRLLVETSGRQAPLLVEAASRAGLRPAVVRCDDLGATIVTADSGTAAAPPAHPQISRRSATIPPGSLSEELQATAKAVRRSGEI